MSTWPLLNRNKVQDSKVHVPVEACAAHENEVVKSLAQKVCYRDRCRLRVGLIFVI
jgi:hypothetical protein